MAPIPITIITGFLGSGKTTILLNLMPQLRAKNTSYRLALLKNEFGDVAIDSQLATSSAISGVRELLNGCICCNLVGELQTALAELESKARPDRIVIETSGSAFPATLAMEVNKLARATAGRYVLDGVISVIDCENWKGYEYTSFSAQVQARYTDLIIYNKWESCPDRLEECRDRVGDLEIDPAPAWVTSDKGRVPVDVVFGIDGGLAQGLTDEDASLAHEQSDAHAHDHQSEVDVLSATLKGPRGAGIDPVKLTALLSSASKDEVYRMKSVLTTSGPVRNSGEDEGAPAALHSPNNSYILNWAFGRWTFSPVALETAEHESTDLACLRMTVITARYEGGKWKAKLESGSFLALAGAQRGELSVTKVA